MANVTRYGPFSLVDDLFKGFLVRPLGFEGRFDGGAQLRRAKLDVSEKNGAYVVSAELPGAKKEDIHVAIDGPQVTIEAEVKREKEESKDERTLYSERAYGMVPVAAAMAAAFVLTATLDVARGDTPLLAESTHLLEMAGFALVWALAGSPGLPRRRGRRWAVTSTAARREQAA